MAYTRKQKKQNEWTAIDKMSGFSVIGSRERFSISFEPFDGMLIAIHGCRVVSGKNGDFISFPAWKDKEGNYHDYAYMTFSDDEKDDIINTLEN